MRVRDVGSVVSTHTRQMKFICFNKSSIYSQSLRVIFMVGNLQSMCEHMWKEREYKKTFILIDHSSQFSRFICIVGRTSLIYEFRCDKIVSNSKIKGRKC